MKKIDKLEVFFNEILNEARNNPDFCQRLNILLSNNENVSEIKHESQKRGGRRSPGIINPFDIYKNGENELIETLSGLDIEKIKDIIAQNGMDTSRLAMKWKNKEKLIDLIVRFVAARNEKGNSFL